MMEYIYLVTIVGIILWSLVNKLDDHAEMKQKERQRMASNVARMNLRSSDKQFTYDVEPPVGLRPEPLALPEPRRARCAKYLG